jgi:hypothetical protein
MAPPLLSWLGKGLSRQTLSSQRSQSTFLGGNLQLATMIRQGMPEVRLRHWPVQIAACLSMMCDDTSPRTVPHASTAVIGMISTTSLKIGGISGSEHHPHHNGPQRRTLLRWEEVDSVLWRVHSDKSGG